MRVKAKIYLRIWLLIDLLGIGLSAVLLLSYLHFSRKPAYPPRLLEIYLLVSFVSLGAWICVRVVHTIFNRKRNFTHARQRLWAVFEDYAKNAGNVLVLTPHHSRKYITRLVKQRKYLRNKWLQQKKSFSVREAGKVQDLLKLQQSILDLCQRISQFSPEDRQEVEYVKAELKSALKLHGEMLDSLRSAE